MRSPALPADRREELLADGNEIVRRTGDALFRFRRNESASTIVSGEPGDATIMGVMTLEELGLILDPFRRGNRSRPPPRVVA